MTVTDQRLAEIAAILTEAGDNWPAVARKLPEYKQHALPVPSGPGVHRAWVLLSEEHEYLEMPMRLLRHENGSWFHKGQYKQDVERNRQWL